VFVILPSANRVFYQLELDWVMTSQRRSPDQIESEPLPKPDEGGFIYSAVPASPKEAQSAKAEARVRQTTKSAIHHYLAEFLDKNGSKRHLLADAAPFAVQFETGITGGQDPDDPLAIQVQLARKWGSLRTALPCIILVDTSYDPKSSGLGGLQPSIRIPGATWDTQAVIVQKVLAKIGINLMVAANTETDASDLCEVLRYILLELTVFTRGHVIEPSKPSDRWEVRLPTNVGMEGLQSQTINDDSRDSFWSSSVTLEVDFEGEIHHAIHHPADGALRETSGHPASLTAEVVIHCAESVSLNEHPRIRIENLHPWACVVTDDFRIAVVDQDLILHPKRLGTCNLMVLRQAPGDSNAVVLAKKTLIVSPV
jgi:hypothetical protein